MALGGLVLVEARFAFEGAPSEAGATPGDGPVRRRGDVDLLDGFWPTSPM